MRLLLSAPVLLLGLSAMSPALAQTSYQTGTSVYAVAGISAWGTDISNDGRYSLSKDAPDFGAGVFYNFPIQSRVTVGLDARVLGAPGDNGGLLAGGALRVGFVPHHNRLRPFFQIGGGVVHTSYTYFLATSSYNPGVQRSVTSGAAQLNFGLDIRLTDSLDLRAPEYGAQAGGRAGGAFLNGGLVYHLHPRRS